MASTSTAATPNIDDHYHVFLQCAQDVKKTFGSHVNRALRRRGFRVFTSKEALRAGETLTPQIRGAITAASVHLPILSPNYATSCGSLEELHLMLNSNADIIPVFFHVSPDEFLRKPCEKGWFGHVLRVFHWLTTRLAGVCANTWFAQALRISPWLSTPQDGVYANTLREALSRVADESGLEMQAFDGDEGALVEEIVKRVEELVRKRKQKAEKGSENPDPTKSPTIFDGASCDRELNGKLTGSPNQV